MFHQRRGDINKLHIKPLEHSTDLKQVSYILQTKPDQPTVNRKPLEHTTDLKQVPSILQKKASSTNSKYTIIKNIIRERWT